MLTKGSEVLNIDAKYYTHTPQTQYDVHTLHSGNLYQISTYVKNKDMEFGEKPHTVSGMLLYAATDEAIQPDNEGYLCPQHFLEGGHNTFTECYDWSGSGCHCMWGSPDAAFYKIFAGITVDHRRPYPVSIRPYFHKALGYVDCEQIITEGTISVKWAYDGENVNVDLTVPVTAEVTLPGHGTMVLPAGAYHYNLIEQI